MRSINCLFGFALIACVIGGCGGGGGGSTEGVVSFMNGPFSVGENGTTSFPVMLHRDGGSGPISVTVMLSDGTATGGPPPIDPSCDYDNTPIVVSWGAGDTADKVVDIPVMNDHSDELNETIHLALANPTGGAAIGTKKTAYVPIMDDDVAGSFQFMLNAYFYGENGVPVATVAIMRVGGSDGVISVTVVSTDGTANSDPSWLVEPLDYTPIHKVLTFEDGETTPRMINIKGNMLQDTIPEGDETFTLSLINLTGGATLAAQQSTVVVTIVDDDPLLAVAGSQPAFQPLPDAAIARVGPLVSLGAPGPASLFDGSDSSFTLTAEPTSSTLRLGPTLTSAAFLSVGLGALEVRDPLTGALLQTIAAPPDALLAVLANRYAVSLGDVFATTSSSILHLSPGGDLVTIPASSAAPHR